MCGGIFGRVFEFRKKDAPPCTCFPKTEICFRKCQAAVVEEFELPFTNVSAFAGDDGFGDGLGDVGADNRHASDRSNGLCNSKLAKPAMGALGGGKQVAVGWVQTVINDVSGELFEQVIVGFS